MKGVIPLQYDTWFNDIEDLIYDIDLILQGVELHLVLRFAILKDDYWIPDHMVTAYTLKGHSRCDLYCPHIICDCWIFRHFRGVTIEKCNSRTWLKEMICSRRVTFLWAHFYEWQGTKNRNHILCWNMNFFYTVQFWGSGNFGSVSSSPSWRSF